MKDFKSGDVKISQATAKDNSFGSGLDKLKSNIQLVVAVIILKGANPITKFTPEYL